METRILIFIVFLFLFSCENEEVSFNDYSSEINFDVSEWILKDKNISCVDFDKEGNAWIASGTELIFYSNRKIESYEVGSSILAIAVATDGTVWLGTRDKGLARFSNNKFVFFNSENSGLPRNLILDVETSPDGSVWFSSSAHQLGGLIQYDGDFKLFTPDNSPINQNLILGLKINAEGEVYFFSEGTVTEAKVFKTDGKTEWTKLGGDVVFYWISAFDLTSMSEPVVVTDHSLSSCGNCYENEVAIYQNGKWNVIERDFEINDFNKMTIDNRDYIWVQGTIQDNYSGYFVFDGDKWHKPEKNKLFDAYIRSVAVDKHNNIWFCTNNGIYILNQ
jgi:hypothetical protein